MTENLVLLWMDAIFDNIFKLHIINDIFSNYETFLKELVGINSLISVITCSINN